MSVFDNWLPIRLDVIFQKTKKGNETATNANSAFRQNLPQRSDSCHNHPWTLSRRSVDWLVACFSIIFTAKLTLCANKFTCWSQRTPSYKSLRRCSSISLNLHLRHHFLSNFSQALVTDLVSEFSIMNAVALILAG